MMYFISTGRKYPNEWYRLSEHTKYASIMDSTEELKSRKAISIVFEILTNLAIQCFAMQLNGIFML
jgi:hypothetical protein